MIKTQDFPNIFDKVEKIKPIFNEYHYEDLIKSVYCINININNRSCLESSLALNMGLEECSRKGTRRIQTYSEFTNFFKKVECFLKPNVMDDITCEDFGEIKVTYNGRSYKILIGTGHTQVFASMYFLPYLAETLDKELELDETYRYVSDTISFFEDTNKNDMSEIPRFVLPSNELFEKTKIYFGTELKKYNLESLYKELNRDRPLIEKLHFIRMGEEIIPLFNTSILVDIYDIWYSKINEEERCLC